MSLDDISFSSLMAGFIFGVIGLYIFRQGMKRVQYGLVFTGIAMMVAPYLTKGAWLDWGVGAALTALAYYIW